MHIHLRFVLSVIWKTWPVLLCSALGNGQTVKEVFAFSSSYSSPVPNYVTPVQGRDGRLYGTTNGIDIDDGIVWYKNLDGSGGVLHAFSGTDGSAPGAGLTLGTDGKLYGAATNGGAYNYGVLFQITIGGGYTVLHEFQGSDGGFPIGAPIEASDGNLYGTTYGDQINNAGTVYRYSRDGTFTNLLSLHGGGLSNWRKQVTSRLPSRRYLCVQPY
jgi:uncharacterized repeat protein (TIGR03803 family)